MLRASQRCRTFATRPLITRSPTRAFLVSAIRCKIQDHDNNTDVSPSPVKGLLAQHAALQKSIKRRISAINARATRLRREQERQSAALEDISRVAPSAYNPHHDLASFLDYAEAVNLKTTTTVFKGTLYEYTVAETLKAYGMTLKRVGKSNDLGIDLLGQWTLPENTHLRVIVQCKMSKPIPALIRELEGSYAGAPSGWEGDDVLALLVSRHAASPGAQQAMQRSKWPLGFVQVDLDATIKQFAWNQVASDRGLIGIGVTSKFSMEDEVKPRDGITIQPSVALTWLGKQWPT